MPSLRDLLSRVTQLQGVRAIVLTGREGLPLEAAGRGDTQLFETLAALGASALQTAEALGQEMPAGATLGVVLEYERALVRVDPLGEFAAVVTLAENAAILSRVRQTVVGVRDEVLRQLDAI
jgi:predicted regulator of Ras-like GTPase activity (Roadblock/LC7/MglB family)